MSPSVTFYLFLEIGFHTEPFQSWFSRPESSQDPSIWTFSTLRLQTHAAMPRLYTWALGSHRSCCVAGVLTYRAISSASNLIFRMVSVIRVFAICIVHDKTLYKYSVLKSQEELCLTYPHIHTHVHSCACFSMSCIFYLAILETLANIVSFIQAVLTQSRLAEKEKSSGVKGSL